MWRIFDKILICNKLLNIKSRELDTSMDSPAWEKIEPSSGLALKSGRTDKVEKHRKDCWMDMMVL